MVATTAIIVIDQFSIVRGLSISRIWISRGTTREISGFVHEDEKNEETSTFLRLHPREITRNPATKPTNPFHIRFPQQPVPLASTFLFLYLFGVSSRNRESMHKHKE